jgi:hypothetical protein
MNKVEVDLLDTLEIVAKQMRYSAAIREIDMAMMEMKFSVVQL